MKKFTRAAPVQLELMRMLSESPLPWTTGMIADALGISAYRRRNLLGQMKSARRIWMVAKGIYTSIDRYVPPVQEEEPISTAHRYSTFSPRGAEDVITDDMLARFGFNL